MFRFPREYSESFNEDAQAYNSVRPGYPEELIEDILGYSQIPPGGSILEIGCGTGQATLPFALRGYKVTAIEPGLNLIEVAKIRCKRLDVDFIATYFENWKTNRKFDLIIAATSWHWIKQGIGFRKADEAMKDNGVLALFWNLHPSPYTGFFLDVQEIYKKLVPDWPSLRDKPSTDMWIQDTRRQIEESGLFSEVTTKEYQWSITYSADDYLKLLDTYSDHRKLEYGVKTDLYHQISELIHKRFDDQVKKPYLSILFLSRKN